MFSAVTTIANLASANLLALVNEMGGNHGIGRVDLVENRYVGLKSRGVYETPGGTILREAHMAVEQITMDREVMHIRDSLIPRYAEMVYYGFWYHAKMDALRAFIGEAQKPVSGEVSLDLYKGNIIVDGRSSPNSLYDEGIAVALGQDDIADAYYPYGRNNMLEVAFLASHLMWMTTFGTFALSTGADCPSARWTA